jgi:hypothetical protein
MTGPDESQVSWRKSSASGGGNCLEVAMLDELVLLRNSHNPRLQLRLTPAEWIAFVIGVRNGEFDSGA